LNSKINRIPFIPNEERYVIMYCHVCISEFSLLFNIIHNVGLVTLQSQCLYPLSTFVCVNTVSFTLYWHRVKYPMLGQKNLYLNFLIIKT